jgi:hypothetical protein
LRSLNVELTKRRMVGLGVGMGYSKNQCSYEQT